MTSFNQHTTGSEVAKALTSRSTGKTFIITGPSSNSIGGATAIALAHSHPKTIFLAGRSESKILPVIKDIKAVDSAVDVIFVPLDLASQASVRKAAGEILASGKADVVHGLINNAGIMCVMPYQETVEGIELQFGINHIGHFLLTNLLLPRIVAAGPHARIVNVASTGYMLGDLDMENYNFDNGKTYHPWLAYASSKTANILFNTYLASHLQDKGVEAFALQPGMLKRQIVPPTELYVHTRDENSLASFTEAFKIITKRWEGKTPPSGDLKGDEKTLETSASTLVFAALDPGLDGKSGLFLRNCEPFPVEGYATNAERAEKLWKLSEKLVEEKFDI
ncbi:Retinol dehydrogenase [Lachnellula hyalina]|uniref:Retinol dehydrogenase n=1 Tax=Lachnellula hyalina TaxID=1316788 RepID=A0A8H8QZF6_9HELO|nr:Retinol dehydrogenase [Lachnellula hyalina]TVY24980.1 Retinol dehydrogenase [Lachnellula hyalina]